MYILKLIENNANVWQLSEKPLLILNIMLEEKSIKKKVQVEKKKDKKDKAKEEADSDDDNELIYFSPSIEQITEQLLEPIRLLIELSNSIYKLEADLVPFLYIQKTTSYKINPEEGFIAEAFNKIKTFIDIGLREPLDIINKFKKYEFLFQKKIRATIKDIRIDSSTEKIREELDRLSRSMREIIFICPNEKNSLFFQIRTKNVKENLLAKAKQLKDHILERLLRTRSAIMPKKLLSMNLKSRKSLSTSIFLMIMFSHSIRKIGGSTGT
jgi:hypothetical protein